MVEIRGLIYSFFFLGRICGDKCIDSGRTCTCNPNESLFDQEVYYCCSNTPCVKNNNGDVTCSSGKKLEFHQKCAKSCPIRSKSYVFPGPNVDLYWRYLISISSSCPEQERCPDGEYFERICLGESYSKMGEFVK